MVAFGDIDEAQLVPMYHVACLPRLLARQTPHHYLHRYLASRFHVALPVVLRAREPWINQHGLVLTL